MAKTALKSVDSGINADAASNVVPLDNVSKRELNLNALRAMATEHGLAEGNGGGARLKLCHDFADRLAAGTARVDDIPAAWNVFATTRNDTVRKGTAPLPCGGRKADTYLTKMRSHCKPEVLANPAWRARVDAMIDLAGKESRSPFEAHYQANTALSAYVKLNRIDPADYAHAAATIDDETIFEQVSKEPKAAPVNAEFMAIAEKIRKLLEPGENAKVDHVQACEVRGGVIAGTYRARAAEIHKLWIALNNDIVADVTAKHDAELTARGE